ncbi:glutamate 5-kinase [Gaopeijia maritima]|uniref:glutamate 5-kinase n=1 Tax=Gaopeijia maritima TaxID=3119007 RepID=UPI0032695DED
MTPRDRLVVKVGSQVLCRPDGALSMPVLERLADRLAHLREQGWDVVLVTSGAVAAGRGPFTGPVPSNPVARRQVLAAVGQVRLMETYRALFDRHGLSVAQVLASKSDFQSRGHYLNMRACIEALLGAGVVPIANENDVVAVTELMFTDNDELAGLLAGLVGARRLVLLSTVAAVLDDAGRPIAEWDDTVHDIADVVQAGTSQLGRGGMRSKLEAARRVAGLGTEVLIADGRDAAVLDALGADRPVGTRFPAGQAASPTRRWLATMEGHALGSVTVNAGAEDALLDRSRLTSLLPIGVDRIEGEFEKGDVIQVRSTDGRMLGCGRSQYDHLEARAVAGRRDHKPLIHCDYLYLVD